MPAEQEHCPGSPLRKTLARRGDVLLVMLVIVVIALLTVPLSDANLVYPLVGTLDPQIGEPTSDTAGLHAAVRLGVKPRLIEIEARIIEVDVDSLDSLGIDWRGHAGSADLKPDMGRRLRARINALAEDGKANILSTPRVLTFDNVEAVLDNLSAFFVPVAGNPDGGPYNASTGTSLRMKPLIVRKDGRTRIKLAVHIEDAGIAQQGIGMHAIEGQTSITAQAFINEGDSLLIGGCRGDGGNVAHVGVPWLSTIPLLGGLFTNCQKSIVHVEHLFMLTPRVVRP